MKQRSLRTLLAFGAATMIGLAGLTACGAEPSLRVHEPSRPLVDLSAEEQALGVEAEPARHDPDDQPKRRWGRHKRSNGLFGRRILHGEMVFDTKDGPRTIVVQRGTVTTLDDTEIAVKSTDGFTLTWTLGEKLRVIERRAVIRADDLEVGDTIALAGPRPGDAPTARLIVITRR